MSKIYGAKYQEAIFKSMKKGEKSCITTYQHGKAYACLNGHCLVCFREDECILKGYTDLDKDRTPDLERLFNGFNDLSGYEKANLTGFEPTKDGKKLLACFETENGKKAYIAEDYYKIMMDFCPGCVYIAKPNDPVRFYSVDFCFEDLIGIVLPIRHNIEE